MFELTTERKFAPSGVHLYCSTREKFFHIVYCMSIDEVCNKSLPYRVIHFMLQAK